MGPGSPGIPCGPSGPGGPGGPGGPSIIPAGYWSLFNVVVWPLSPLSPRSPWELEQDVSQELIKESKQRLPLALMYLLDRLDPEDLLLLALRFLLVFHHFREVLAGHHFPQDLVDQEVLALQAHPVWDLIKSVN